MKRKLEVIQEEISDCGASCLLSIIRYYDGDASLEQLRVSSLTSKDGVNMFNLIECAKDLGFDAKGIKEKDLSKLNLPCILHININNALSHFICLYKINNSSVLIMDPACGFKTISVDELLSIYTGNSIQLIPRIKLVKEKANNTLIHIIKNELKNNSKKLIILLFINFIFIVLSIINSTYIEFMTKYKSIYIILLFIFINILTTIVSYFINVFSINISNIIGKHLLSNFFDHIFRLPLKYIHIKSSGEIIKRVHDMEHIKDVLSNFIINTILNTIIIISISIILTFVYTKILLLIVLFIIILLYLTTKLFKGINKKINNTIIDSTDYENDLVDSLNGLTSIYHSNSNKYMFNKLNASMIKSLDSNTNFNIYSSQRELIKNILSNSFIFLINTILFIDVINNSISINTFIIINCLLNLINSSLEGIINYIPSILYIKNIIRKINEFYLIKENDEQTSDFINGDIEIKNISFSYNKYSKVLNNKNIYIKKGEKIIFKGESGCGKSTLCKILNKEYEYDGSIKINDKELSNISLKQLRNNLTYSSQDEYIFNGTIKDNITLGLKVDDQEFNKIAKICMLDRIIKNRPFKYDTFLFGGAGDLSGGERNLIILARALIRNSKILILDETMKELNDEVENKILNNIFNYYKDTTIIYVSHKNKKEYFKRCIYV